MNTGLIDRVQTSVEWTASLLFGGAVAYAAYIGLKGAISLPELAVFAAASGMVAHLLCSRALKANARGTPQYDVRVFDVREIETAEPDELLLTAADELGDELLLTDADRVGDELLLTDRVGLVSQADEMLILDDILAELGPDSRVVRLFDRKAMPTPGQLKSRIDHHIGQGPAQSDASQALSDALAELRRSLR
jgi:hypothetical protein